ncbi:hypothetical protein LFT46_15625 [Arthrobacter sp. FW306-07-I]|nr:hypothetical protein [Arthrobacter sp. FW306-07-I]UKA74576.1 hypothetical protein LFT46_15625 [Arthrobacter sp. FW306-07-I]
MCHIEIADDLVIAACQPRLREAGPLARDAIVVITDKDEVSSQVDKDAIEEHLAGICRELIAVPHDRGVADGDLVTLDVLKPETRRAYKEIAAAIVDGYR